MNCSNAYQPRVLDCSEDLSYPYYPDPLYQVGEHFSLTGILKNTIRNYTLVSSMSFATTCNPFQARSEKKLSSSRWKNIFFMQLISKWQATYGSTGDVTPWHGDPICPESFPDCYLDAHSPEVAVSLNVFVHFRFQLVPTHPEVVTKSLQNVSHFSVP